MTNDEIKMSNSMPSPGIPISVPPRSPRPLRFSFLLRAWRLGGAPWKPSRRSDGPKRNNVERFGSDRGPRSGVFRAFRNASEFMFHVRNAAVGDGRLPGRNEMERRETFPRLRPGHGRKDVDRINTIDRIRLESCSSPASYQKATRAQRGATERNVFAVSRPPDEV